MIPVGRWFACVLAAVAAGGMLAWAGCSCEESEPPEEEVVIVQPEQKKAAPARQGAEPRRKVGESIIDAPADYLRTTAIAAPRYARKTLDTAYIQNEVRQFNALKGRLPRSLDELVEWRGQPLPETPKGYVYSYDPATGKLEVVREE